MGCGLTQSDISSTVFTNNSSKLLIKIATANYAHRLCLAASVLDVFQHQGLAFPKCFSSLCTMITAEFIWHNEHKMVSCLLFSLKKQQRARQGNAIATSEHMRSQLCCATWISAPPFTAPTCLSGWLFWPAARLSFTSWSERWESSSVSYWLLFSLFFYSTV